MSDVHKANSTKRATSQKPYTLVGAGPLTATILKNGDERAGWRYRFNIIRTNPESGRVTQRFEPGDIVHFVKLLHLLAFTLADDGCHSDERREELRMASDCLAEVLDTIADGSRTEE